MTAPQHEATAPVPVFFWTSKMTFDEKDETFALRERKVIDSFD